MTDSPEPASQSGDRPAGYLELLRENPIFRRFFVARVISLLGDWFNTLAVLALLREIGGADARSFGWILILKTLPQVLMTPFAGVVVDRLSRKALMICMDLLRAGLVLAMFFLDELHAAMEEGSGGAVAPVILLYALIFLMTVGRSISEPARNAVVPDIVAKKDLVTANAMGAAAWSLMFTMGTALGGLVTAGLGWEVALAIDIGTYLVSAGLILSLAIPEVAHKDRGSGSFVEGLRYLAQRPRLWTLAAVKTGWSCAGGITLILTILGERYYEKTLAGVDFVKDAGLDAALLAVTCLYVARGVGTGLGPILSRWICGSDPVKAEKIIAVGFFWGAGFYLIMGQVESLPLAMLCLVLSHLGGATVWVFSTVRLQSSLPTEVRGRVFACEQGGFTFTMALSTYMFSTAIDLEWVSLPSVASVLGLVMAVPGCFWLLRCALLGFGPPPPSEASPPGTAVRDSAPGEV